MIPENELHSSIPQTTERIETLYESTNYAKAVREIMGLADKTNRFIDEKKPWILIKDPKKRAKFMKLLNWARHV